MAFKSINSNGPFVKPKLMKKGDTITGYYTGTWASKDYPDSPSIIVKLSEPAKIITGVKEGDSYVDQEVEVPAGQEVRLNASGNLKYFINDQEKGYLYQFIYKGMHELTSGKAAGKMSHKFDILKDEDSRINSSDEASSFGASDDIPF